MDLGKEWHFNRNDFSNISSSWPSNGFDEVETRPPMIDINKVPLCNDVQGCSLNSRMVIENINKANGYITEVASQCSCNYQGFGMVTATWTILETLEDKNPIFNSYYGVDFPAMILYFPTSYKVKEDGSIIVHSTDCFYNPAYSLASPASSPPTSPVYSPISLGYSSNDSSSAIGKRLRKRNRFYYGDDWIINDL